jgi:hypothetical protein
VDRGLGSLVEWDRIVGFALRIRIGVCEVLESFCFFLVWIGTGVSFLQWSSAYGMIGTVGVESTKKLVDLQSRQRMSELCYYLVAWWNRVEPAVGRPVHMDGYFLIFIT